MVPVGGYRHDIQPPLRDGAGDVTHTASYIEDAPHALGDEREKGLCISRLGPAQVLEVQFLACLPVAVVERVQSQDFPAEEELEVEIIVHEEILLFGHGIHPVAAAALINKCM